MGDNHGKYGKYEVLPIMCNAINRGVIWYKQGWKPK